MNTHQTPDDVTRTDGVQVRNDGRGKWTVLRGDQELGIVLDEGAMPRGRYAAWSPQVEKPGNVALFSDDPAEAVEAIVQACPPAETEEQAPAMPAPIAEGDRVLCSDGLVRTAAYTEVSNGKSWIHMTDRSAWPRKTSERIDTSLVPAITGAALRAATRLAASPATPDPNVAAALGDALKYLRRADPATHAELVDGAERILVRVPRADVAPGDILHTNQGRHDVLDVATVGEGGDRPTWWARVLGATKDVRAYTGRRSWNTSLRLDLARTELATVERPLPGIAATPASAAPDGTADPAS